MWVSMCACVCVLSFLHAAVARWESRRGGMPYNVDAAYRVCARYAMCTACVERFSRRAPGLNKCSCGALGHCACVARSLRRNKGRQNRSPVFEFRQRRRDALTDVMAGLLMFTPAVHMDREFYRMAAEALSERVRPWLGHGTCCLLTPSLIRLPVVAYGFKLWRSRRKGIPRMGLRDYTGDSCGVGWCAFVGTAFGRQRRLQQRQGSL